MRKAIKRAVLVLACLICVLTVSAQRKLSVAHIPPTEMLSYDIYYHWGMIWKRAGEGTFILKPTTYKGEDVMQISLYGRTLSFVEKIFPVRDTLSAFASRDGFIPRFYTKIIHEGGYNATDIIRYSYGRGVTTTSIREIGNRGGIEDTTIHRTSPVYDMLTVFYYLRTLDLHKARPNQVFPVEVVTGRHIYKLKFKFLGMEEVDMRNGAKRMVCYKVQMVFENTYGKVDDDTMIAYIGDDDARTPVQLEAKLRIGSMRAILR